MFNIVVDMRYVEIVRDTICPDLSVTVRGLFTLISFDTICADLIDVSV